MTVIINKKLLLEDQMLGVVGNDLLTKAKPILTNPVKLEKYNVNDAKKSINDELDKDPELPEKVVEKVKSIEESTLGDVQKNLNSPHKSTLTKAGHLVSNRTQESKDGLANSLQGAKEVITNQIKTTSKSNGIDGVTQPVSSFSESTNNILLKVSNLILEDMHSMTGSVGNYKQLTTTQRPNNTMSSGQQKVETHFDKTVNSPTRQLKQGEKVNVANKLGQETSSLQQVRDNLKKLNNMSKSVSSTTPTIPNT